MDKLEFVGQVSIRKILVTSLFTDTELDITNMILEMNIYEDLYTNWLTGTITVSDSIDVINNLPLIGEEKIEIEYKTPTLDDNIGLVSNSFYITKIADRKLINENAQVYIIHFMSTEAFTDLHVKIGRAYRGQFSDIARRIFTEADALGAADDVAAKLRIEETSNGFKFVAPGWSPMKCINWVASRSISRAYNSSNYLFYQDNFRYNFVSIDSLIDQEPVINYINKSVNIRTIENSVELQGLDNLPNRYNIVRSASNDLVFDVTDRMLNGMYAGKLISYDIMSKKVNIKTYDYFDDFRKTKHLNEYPLNSPKLLRNPNSYVTYYPMHYYMHDGFETDEPASWVLQRRSLMRQIDAYSSEIVVAGRSDIHVGQTITYTQNTIQHHTNDDDAIDNTHTGKYLITAICHRFSQNEHEMVLSISKDSTQNSLGGQ